MKYKKYALGISGISLFTLLFFSFQNFTSYESKCEDELCRGILNAIRKSRAQNNGLAANEIIEHAANKFGYGVSPMGPLTPINADAQKVEIIASYLSNEAKSPRFVSSPLKSLGPVFTYKESGFSVNVLDRSQDLRDEYSRAYQAYLQKKIERDQAEGTASRRELEILNAEVRRQRKVFQRLSKETADLHQKLTVARALVGSQSLSNNGVVDHQVNFREVLQEFWFNHFNVDTSKAAKNLGGINGYEYTIHSKMYSTFKELLYGVITHPAMLVYLDNHNNRIVAVENSDSTISRIASNQNLGREILELHTLGVGPRAEGRAQSPYTQKDVEESSRILAGVNTSEGLFVFNELKALRNTEYCVVKDGQTQCQKEIPVVMKVSYDYPGISRLQHYIDNLSNHPYTKRFICRKLVNRFVSPDSGARELKERCVANWGNGGDLKAIYASILTHPGTWSKTNYRRVFKNPYELAVSQIRAKGISVRELMDNSEYANHVIAVSIDHSKKLGVSPRKVEPPTGYDQRGNTWVSSGYYAQATSLSFNATYISEMFDQHTEEDLKVNLRRIASLDADNNTFNSVDALFHLMKMNISGTRVQHEGIVGILADAANYGCSVPRGTDRCEVVLMKKTASDLTTSQFTFMKR